MNSTSVAASTAEIVDTLTFFDDWEDRYRYIIDLGRELPDMPLAQRRAPPRAATKKP